MAATDRPANITGRLALAAGSLLAGTTQAAVLPEPRADALFHHYDGGGMEISGPSLLVRENFAEKVSLAANYYVDSVTSASIDVKTTASPYTEERIETRLSADYLQEKTRLGVGWVQSEESDYSASTLGFSVSQDFFGDLSTITFGYDMGSDEVRRNGDPAFGENVQRHGFRLGYSQVLSRKVVIGTGIDVIADEGYLNNPYRSVRFVDGSSALGYAWQPEVYPRTRTSTALGTRLAWHLGHDDALKVEYRLFSDTWGIDAQNLEVGYSRDLTANWRVDARVRTYSQGAADFYSDLFPYRDAQNYLARDKELSTFDSLLLGVGAAYIIKAPETSRWKQMSFNVQLDFIDFEYSDFRNVRGSAAAPGSEPLYSYDATVTRIFYSLWF